MTNKQFWQRLDNIMKKPQDHITTIEFIQMLLQGGDEDLSILALCTQDKQNPDLAYQIYAGPQDSRIMLCYTSEVEAKKNRRPLPSDDKRKIKCLPLSLRDVLNNALQKDSIAALSFNSENSHRYVIPKQMILMVIEAIDDIQNGRIDISEYEKHSPILPS